MLGLRSTSATVVVASYAVLLCSTLSGVWADVSINDPVKDTTWMAKQPATVRWTYIPDGSNPPATVNVQLMQGNNPDDVNSMTLVKNLGTVKESDGSLSVTAPSDLAPGVNYAIRIGTRYSHVFAINGGSATANPTPTNTNSPTPAPTPTTTTTTDSSTTTSTSTTSKPSPSSSVIRVPSNAAPPVTGTQPLMLTGSLIALIPVAVVAIWGF